MDLSGEGEPELPRQGNSASDRVNPARKFVKRDFRKIKGAIPVDGIETLHESDVIILVMGAPGVGKSTFIQTVAGPHYDWRPERSTISALRITFNDDDNTDLILVDTPGFDDPEKSDSQVLEIIAQWLQEVGKNASAKISGIVHLHSLVSIEGLDRYAGEIMPDSAIKNLEMLQQLCGKEFYHKVILTTTRWPNHHLSFNADKRLVRDCWEREQALKRTYWKSMIAGGVRVHRFPNTCNTKDSCFSAQAIINKIIRTRGQPPMMKVQREMICDFKSILETQAGRLLYGAPDEAQDTPAPIPTLIRVDTSQSMESDESTSTITSDWFLSPGGLLPIAFRRRTKAAGIRIDHLLRRAKYNTTQSHAPNTTQPDTSQTSQPHTTQSHVTHSYQPRNMWERVRSWTRTSSLPQGRQMRNHGYEGDY